MQPLQAQVLYDYEAQDGDQLTIKPGDIIEIIDDSPDLNGWALAKRGDKEGYVPAEYVRYVDPNPYDYGDNWRPTGFQTYYTNVLSQEHHLPFPVKLRQAMKDVLVPCPCSRFSYVMRSPDLQRGAILHLIFAFIVTAVDCFTILAPCVPFDTKKARSPNTYQIILTCLNSIFRAILTLYFVRRYPRPNLSFTTFPYLNVLGSLTFSIRVYELLEMGDNKEYDGYRYYRSWMWSSLVNVPFTIIGLILVLTGSPGLSAVSIVVLVLNILNVGRCFLASWASVEAGNEIHPDFETTIKTNKL